jgi:hypothetical protein
VGTSDWVELEQSLAVSGSSRLIEVAVTRTPSLKFDSKVAGTIWIDDVSLERE